MTKVPLMTAKMEMTEEAQTHAGGAEGPMPPMAG